MNDLITAIIIADEYLDGENYEHAIRVMKYVKENKLINYSQLDKYCAVALLHDVLEDTDLTLNDLTGLNVSSDVCRAVELLTRNDIPYRVYIENIANEKIDNNIAYYVKLADIKDHLTLKETLKPELKERYTEALRILI